jgi:predicted DNA-binding transcriptional regulator AlpA
LNNSSEKLPRLLSADAVSALLGVSIGTLAVWRSTRRYPLPFVKIGGLVRYREGDVAEFIDGRIRGWGEQPTKAKTSRSRT